MFQAIPVWRLETKQRQYRSCFCHRRENSMIDFIWKGKARKMNQPVLFVVVLLTMKNLLSWRGCSADNGSENKSNKLPGTNLFCIFSLTSGWVETENLIKLETLFPGAVFLFLLVGPLKVYSGDQLKLWLWQTREPKPDFRTWSPTPSSAKYWAKRAQVQARTILRNFSPSPGTEPRFGDPCQHWLSLSIWMVYDCITFHKILSYLRRLGCIKLYSKTLGKPHSFNNAPTCWLNQRK